MSQEEKVIPLEFDEVLQDMLKKKSPLRGTNSSGSVVFYWFKEYPLLEGEITSDKILVDKDCQLPEGIFTLLPIDGMINESCCMYFEKAQAFFALKLAVERFSEYWRG
jgi:hypothetical protein